jgi:hypothetical protein
MRRARPGLLFMGYSFPDQVPTDVLTITSKTHSPERPN